MDGVWATPLSSTEELLGPLPQPELVPLPASESPLYLQPKGAPHDYEFAFESLPVGGTDAPYDQPPSGKPRDTAAWRWTYTFNNQWASHMSFPGTVTMEVKFTVTFADAYAPIPSSKEQPILTIDVADFLSRSVVKAFSVTRSTGQFTVRSIISGAFAYLGVPPKFSLAVNWGGWFQGDWSDRHQFYVVVRTMYSSTYMTASLTTDWECVLPAVSPAGSEFELV